MKLLWLAIATSTLGSCRDADRGTSTSATVSADGWLDLGIPPAHMMRGTALPPLPAVWNKIVGHDVHAFELVFGSDADISIAYAEPNADEHVRQLIGMPDLPPATRQALSDYQSGSAERLRLSAALPVHLSVKRGQPVVVFVAATNDHQCPGHLDASPTPEVECDAFRYGLYTSSASSETMARFVSSGTTGSGAIASQQLSGDASMTAELYVFEELLVPSDGMRNRSVAFSLPQSAAVTIDGAAIDPATWPGELRALRLSIKTT